MEEDPSMSASQGPCGRSRERTDPPASWLRLVLRHYTAKQIHPAKAAECTSQREGFQLMHGRAAMGGRGNERARRLKSPSGVRPIFHQPVCTSGMQMTLTRAPGFHVGESVEREPKGSFRFIPPAKKWASLHVPEQT